MIKDNKGFMLLETLIVTAFVSCVLIYLFVQLSNITSRYSESFVYNNVDDIYALDDLANYINSDELLATYIEENILGDYIDFSSCNYSYFTDENYCEQLLSNLKISEFIVSKNNLDEIDFESLDSMGLKKFIRTLKSTNFEDYRIIAIIDGKRYASIIFNLGSGL